MNRLTVRPCLVLLLLLAACSGNRTGPRSSHSSGTGSGIVITADDIAAAPGQSIEQILMAHVPGLTFGRADNGQTIITMRGTTTFMGERGVLVVVNGIALSPGAVGNLYAINLRDIESITVLRDAAMTAQYGTRGANGVILIRTKQS